MFKKIITLFAFMCITVVTGCGNIGIYFLRISKLAKEMHKKLYTDAAREIAHKSSARNLSLERSTQRVVLDYMRKKHVSPYLR